MKTNYKHTQIGYLIIIIFSITSLILMLTLFHTGLDGMSLGVLAIVVLAGVIFSTLSVMVTEDQVKLHFTFGLFRTSFPLMKIKTVRVVRNPWYYGWGIHLTMRGWVYNVSGFSAVELELINGNRYRIGSDDAAGLAEAIATALETNSSIHPPLE